MTLVVEPQQELHTRILAHLEQIDGLLRTYAASAHLDYDDLKGDACLIIMDILAHKPSRTHTRAYISVVVRSRIIDKIRYNQRRQAESLDALSAWPEDGSVSLADLLPSNEREPGELLVAREEIASWLPQIQQQYGRRRSKCRELAETALASLAYEEAAR